MPDEPLTADSPEYRAIVERAKANRELMREANGADGTLDATRIEALRRRLGPANTKQVHMTAVCVAEATQPLFRVIKQLDERIAELEKGRLEYCGVWAADNVYTRGNLVTHGGSCWHANHNETSGEPGKSGDAWTLMVKRGKDGR